MYLRIKCPFCSGVDGTRCDERKDDGSFGPGRFIRCMDCKRCHYAPHIVEVPRRLCAEYYREFAAGWKRGAFGGIRLGQAFCSYFGFREKADKDLFHTSSDERAQKMITRHLRDYQIFDEGKEEIL